MKVLVNNKAIGEITTNRSMTIEEAMYSLSYDITSQKDCEQGHRNGIEGFYLDDCGNYEFDVEATELIY